VLPYTGRAMDIEIRRIGAEHYEEFLRMLFSSFSEQHREDIVEAERPIFATSRTHSAFDGDAMVGSTSAAPFELTVPGGGFVPCAGITSVGVLPTHRRRGVLRQLMRTQLDDIREQGQLVAYLWASEATIYQRYGYGVGALMGSFDIRKSTNAFLRPFERRGRVRMVSGDEAMKIMPSVYERARPERPGFISRDEEWWKAIFRDPEYERDGATSLFFVIHEGDEGVEGYVAYRVKEGWEPDIGPDYTMTIEELMTATDHAYASLWRYCLDVDLVRRVKGWRRPADETLLHMLMEPRALSFSVRDGSWLRVVDARAALEARRYPTEGRLVLDLRDEFCSWNEGRWELEGGPDGATVKASQADPDVTLRAEELAATYLSAVRPSALARAGRIQGSPEAVRRADAMFATELAPWCPHVF
jgi:predicted acetyltransferase